MRATRRWWAAAALAAALALLSLLVDRPLLLVGAAGLAAALVAAQVAFALALVRTRATLDVEQSLEADRAIVDEPVTLTLAATVPDAAPLDLAVEAGLSLAATGPDRDHRSVRVDRGGRSARVTVPVTPTTAGRLAFEPPTVTASDPLGLLTESFPHGPGRTLAVEPRAPRDVHVGEAGDRLAGAFGDHPTGRLGPGITPTELREYAPGDAASRIDWKATARLSRPYVREAEAETDRRTALLLDHRAAMARGPEGETKLDYAREVALAIAASARDHDDPLGCYAVGDGGLSVAHPPEAAPGGYAAVRRSLLDLEPTAIADGGRVDATAVGPAAAGRAAARLQGDDSAFATTLRPFLADAAAYVERIDAEPLFRAAESVLGRLTGTLWTVVLTDDTRRAEVREAVKAARRGDDHVLVLLTPDVLFEPGGLADLEAAYDRYADFEAFRRELAALDRVTALELAPGDRLAAVLSTGRARRDEGRWL